MDIQNCREQSSKSCIIETEWHNCNYQVITYFQQGTCHQQSVPEAVEALVDELVGSTANKTLSPPSGTGLHPSGPLLSCPGSRSPPSNAHLPSGSCIQHNPT